MYAAGVPVISDLIPFLKWIDLFGQVKFMKRVAKEFDSLVGSWVDEHTTRVNGDEPSDKLDFIDVMLSKIEENPMFGHTRETIIKATATGLWRLEGLAKVGCFCYGDWKSYVSFKVCLRRPISPTLPSHTVHPSRPVLHLTAHPTQTSLVLHLTADPSSIADLSFIIDPSSTGHCLHRTQECYETDQGRN
nr:cytochrome p450 cyp82d47 [Quercus suber]